MRRCAASASSRQPDLSRREGGRRQGCVDVLVEAELPAGPDDPAQLGRGTRAARGFACAQRVHYARIIVWVKWLMATNADRDFIQSLDHGLAVLEAFSANRQSLTVSQAAEATGLTRATARRVLLTLQRLGFVRDGGGREFALTPRVLRLGYSYLSSLDLRELAEPVMAELGERTGESVSLTVLDGTDVVYVARVSTRRVMALTTKIGSRVPAYATSMGRVLLSHLPPPRLDAYFREATLARLTSRTVTDEPRLREILGAVRDQGWSLVDEELEEGLRSIAAPIRDASGEVTAALTICGHAGRVTVERLRDDFLPQLLRATRDLSDLASSAEPVALR
jgi:IclR family transcriptional regulator, pca regulon regulatory protein